MQKTLRKAALIASLLSISGCSRHNFLAPDWAQIGSSGTETEAKASSEENNSVWWSPFSWL